MIVPSTPVTDSAPYPLSTLLIVQRDFGLAQTRFYAFRGQLGRADLGIEDLRRVALRFNAFQMAFEPVPERFEPDGLPKSRGNPLVAKLSRDGGSDLTLIRLNDDSLHETGATRWLARVSSTDYDVSAYFGVIDTTEPASIEIARAGLDYEPPDAAPDLKVTRDEEEFSVEFDSYADFVVVELAQPIQAKLKEDAEEDAGTEPFIQDGLVRISNAPSTKYRATRALITDVAGQGCWSREQPIQVRLRQFFRRYQQRAKGDWAVVYERIDALEISAEEWTALLEDPTPANYCKDYEAATP